MVKVVTKFHELYIPYDNTISLLIYSFYGLAIFSSKSAALIFINRTIMNGLIYGISI